MVDSILTGSFHATLAHLVASTAWTGHVPVPENGLMSFAVSFLGTEIGDRGWWLHYCTRRPPAVSWCVRAATWRDRTPLWADPEIDYARSLGKPVRFTRPETDPDPEPLPATTYEISLHGSATTVAVQAVEPVPGLHIYRLPEALHGPDDVTHPWRLGYHSGPRSSLPHPTTKLRAAREIADMTDCSRSASDLVSGSSFDLDEYIDRLTERTNALFISAGLDQFADSADEPQVQS